MQDICYDPQTGDLKIALPAEAAGACLQDMKKARSFRNELLLMVTRTGIEPMLPP